MSKVGKSSQKTLRVDFEREIEWLRAKRDEVWQRVALLERVAGGDHVQDGDEMMIAPRWVDNNQVATKALTASHKASV